MMVRWSGEVQVNVIGMSNLNLSLTLVGVKLVSTYFGAYLIHIELAIVNNMSYSEQYEITSQ